MRTHLLTMGLMAMACFGHHLAVGAEAAKTNAADLLPIRAAVLPFHNGSGDPAFDDWQHGLSSLVRMLLHTGNRLEVSRTIATRKAVDLLGVKLHQIAAEHARLAAAELSADLVVWGTFRRGKDDCSAEISVLKLTSTSPTLLQVTAPGWLDLAEAIAIRVAEHVEQPLSRQDRIDWRSELTDSESALRLLAKSLALATTEAPAAEREETVRALLKADPRCAAAYNSYRDILVRQTRTNDLDALGREFLKHRPDMCEAHLTVAGCDMLKGDNEAAERGMRIALRVHPGCPGAARGLTPLLGKGERKTELRQILEDSFAKNPGRSDIRVLLACARSIDDDNAGAAALLRPMQDIPEEDEMIDSFLLSAAAWTSNFNLLGLTLLRIGPKAVTNQSWIPLLTNIVAKKNEVKPGPAVVPPRRFTRDELERELATRLSPEERALVANPIEITPALREEARRLTAGLPTETGRAVALFSEVGRRGRGHVDVGHPTAAEALKETRDPAKQFVCQEYAKLFVALARAIGIEAWLVHVDRDAYGQPGYHDCAAATMDGVPVLVDPTWRVIGIPHQAFTVLDDIKAISHHAMQPLSSGPDARRLRAGLKLNPEDRWTRLQFVRGMIGLKEYATASEELKKLEQEFKTWDVYHTTARLKMTQGNLNGALESLTEALALSPSNAVVHLELSDLYRQLNNPKWSKEHLKLALQMNRGEISKDSHANAAFTLGALDAAARRTSNLGGENMSTLLRKAEAGDLSAQVAVAQSCFDARPPEVEKGLQWLRKAAAQGNPQAQLNYARILFQFRGKDVGSEVAVWVRKAAEQGFAEAQHRLAAFLFEGNLVPQDRVAAYAWASLAAAQGDKDAKWLVKDIELFLSAAEMADAKKRAERFASGERHELASPPAKEFQKQ